MYFDPSTLFVVVVTSTFANAALLGWAWYQNRHERTLKWLAVGYVAAGIGSLFLAGRGMIPEVLTVDIANAVIVYGVGTIWVAARVFDGRPAPQAVPLAGVGIWLVAVQIPAIGDSYAVRVIVAAVLTAFYCAIAARELWLSDGLRSRVPVAAVLVAHAVVVASRIPIALVEAENLTAEFTSQWFAPMTLETLVFVQALALLMVSLTKERAESRLKTMALTDPLTGLANRRAFFADGQRLVAAARRMGQPTALIAFDLDRFKAINDTFGHPFGDAVLEAFALASREGLRAGDLVGRIGGEEFAALLPGADADEAMAAATRVVALFADIVGVADGERVRFTTSAGLAVSKASTQTIEALLISADRALYEAKNAGGNQLRAAEPAMAWRFAV